MSKVTDIYELGEKLKLEVEQEYISDENSPMAIETPEFYYNHHGEFAIYSLHFDYVEPDDVYKVIKALNKIVKKDKQLGYKIDECMRSRY